jgi:hypothetical protein
MKKNDSRPPGSNVSTSHQPREVSARPTSAVSTPSHVVSPRLHNAVLSPPYPAPTASRSQRRRRSLRFNTVAPSTRARRSWTPCSRRSRRSRRLSSSGRRVTLRTASPWPPWAAPSSSRAATVLRPSRSSTPTTPVTPFASCSRWAPSSCLETNLQRCPTKRLPVSDCTTRVAFPALLHQVPTRLRRSARTYRGRAGGAEGRRVGARSGGEDFRRRQRRSSLRCRQRRSSYSCLFCRGVIWLGSHASIGESVHSFVSVFPAILIRPRALLWIRPYLGIHFLAGSYLTWN